MRALPLIVSLCLTAVATGQTTVEAQDRDAAGDAGAQPWPATAVTDLWHKLRPKDQTAEQDPETADSPQRRFFVVAPAIGSRPATGLTLGVKGNMAFFQGDPSSTHISTMIGGFRISQKKQVLSNIRFSVFTEDDRWFLQGAHRVSWTSLTTTALASDGEPLDAANLKYNFVRLYETAYRTVKPGLFIGG